MIAPVPVHCFSITFSKQSGKSFIKLKYKVGPRMDPCDTPDCILENSVSPFSRSMDSEQSIYLFFFKKMEWAEISLYVLTYICKETLIIIMIYTVQTVFGFIAS